MTLDRRTNSSISSIEAMEVSRTARAKISESAPMIVSEIYAILSELKQAGRAILLVEQNVAQALTVCGRFVAMERGRLALEGDARPNQIASSCCRSWRSEGTAPF